MRFAEGNFVKKITLSLNIFSIFAKSVRPFKLWNRLRNLLVSSYDFKVVQKT